MIQKTGPSYWVRIYISGPIDVATQVIREECLREGLCVTISPTTFVYTGGEETGYVVGLLNYPRFPVSEYVLRKRARDLLLLLLGRTAQHSGLLQTPTETEWVSFRPESQ